MKFTLEGIDKQNYIEKMSEWMNDDENTKYMVLGLYPPNIENLAAEYDDLTSGRNIIFFIKPVSQSRIIGYVGLYNINGQARHAELRILLEKGSGGKGYGVEVTKLIVKYGFEKLNLNKVWLGVNAKNKGAIKCYEKAGFTKESVLRQEIFRNNQYYDAVRMSILRREYEENKR